MLLLVSHILREPSYCVSFPRNLGFGVTLFDKHEGALLLLLDLLPKLRARCLRFHDVNGCRFSIYKFSLSFEIFDDARKATSEVFPKRCK